jgi:signal transduction histidine kinase
LPAEETRLPDGLGGTRIVHETASLVLDGRELLGAVSVIRDVTEQRRLEERVASADRLAALGTIAAGIAHEINNPLAVLSGHSDLLIQTLEQRRDELPSGASTERASLDEMIAGQIDCVDAIRRITRVIGDLRSFAARPDPTRAGANIAEAIAHAIRSTAPRLVGRARIVLDDGTPGAHAAIARPHLEQVVAHLLTNAAQASPLGRPDDHPITLVVRRTGTFVTLEVRDSGAGLAPDVAKRVFEPFFTTREVGRGSGLGLAICHGLVNRAGGHIECESELGRGATFRITLPEASP